MVVLVGERQDLMRHDAAKIVDDGDKRQVHAMLLMHEHSDTRGSGATHLQTRTGTEAAAWEQSCK